MRKNKQQRNVTQKKQQQANNNLAAQQHERQAQPETITLNGSVLLSMLGETHAYMSRGEEVIPVHAGVFEKMIHELILLKLPEQIAQ
ncbi:hypothetical protein HEF39_003710 [Escherichia coli]|nr:hypothetical protein [Escherichia coli]